MVLLSLLVWVSYHEDCIGKSVASNGLQLQREPIDQLHTTTAPYARSSVVRGGRRDFRAYVKTPSQLAEKAKREHLG